VSAIGTVCTAIVAVQLFAGLAALTLLAANDFAFRAYEVVDGRRRGWPAIGRRWTLRSAVRLALTQPGTRIRDHRAGTWVKVCSGFSETKNGFAEFVRIDHAAEQVGLSLTDLNRLITAERMRTADLHGWFAIDSADMYALQEKLAAAEAEAALLS
jgi:hypothetical protein